MATKTRRDRPGARMLVELGGRVRRLRRERALTLRALANRCHLSERFLSSVEAGRANISVLNLAEVAAALGVSTADLFQGIGGKNPRERIVSLLGLRGAGKTSVGKGLAERLGCAFVELDQRVEQEAGLRLAEIFAMHGETYYRELEHRALRRFLAAHSRAVLAAGGGVVSAPETFQLLSEGTTTVWLKALPEEHWQRVVRQGDLRPIANRPHAMAELRRRLAEREPHYARAKIVCSTSGKTVVQVVGELCGELEGT